MSRGTKRTKAQKRERRRKSDAEHFEMVVRDTAERFTCSEQIVVDFANQCARLRDHLECDILFNDIDCELWQHLKYDDAANKLVQALDDFAAERQRHLAAVEVLHRRFDEIAGDSSFYQQLGPVQQYREHVRRRIGPPPA